MKHALSMIVSALCLMNLPTPVTAQQQRGDYYGPHMMWDGWHGMFFGPLVMIIFITVATVVIVLIVRWLGGATHRGSAHPTFEQEPLDILKARFARGELDKEEFEERRRVLREK